LNGSGAAFGKAEAIEAWAALIHFGHLHCSGSIALPASILESGTLHPPKRTLFDVIARGQEKFRRPRAKCLLCFSNALREFIAISFEESGSIKVCPNSFVWKRVASSSPRPLRKESLFARSGNGLCIDTFSVHYQVLHVSLPPTVATSVGSLANFARYVAGKAFVAGQADQDLAISRPTEQ
jgi:hypothetical protein